MLLWVAWVYKYLLQTLLSMLLGIYPEMWLPDHMAILYVVSSIVATPFYILPSGAQNFQFRYILPKYVIWGVLDSSHSHRCEVVSYCSFIYISLRKSIFNDTIISGMGGATIGYFKYFWRLWYTGHVTLLCTQYCVHNLLCTFIKIKFYLSDKTSFIR